MKLKKTWLAPSLGADNLFDCHLVKEVMRQSSCTYVEKESEKIYTFLYAKDTHSKIEE